MDKARAIISIALLLAVGGCASTGSLCSLGPFIPDAGAGDRWTDGEKDDLLFRNGSGVEICGWQKPGSL